MVCRPGMMLEHKDWSMGSLKFVAVLGSIPVNRDYHNQGIGIGNTLGFPKRIPYRRLPKFCLCKLLLEFLDLY